MKRLTKKEIILETVEYYKTHELAYSYDMNGNIGGCDYKNNKGDMCALGRCFDPKKAVYDFIQYAYKYEEKYGIDNHLKEKYKGHEVDFWIDLQNLHDEHLKTDTEQEKIKELLIKHL